MTEKLSMRHKREAELVEYYDQHVNYMSSVKPENAVKVVERLIDEPLQRNTRILDIGSGDGRVSTAIADQVGCQVLGIDCSPARVEKANKRVDELGLQFRAEYMVDDISNCGLYSNDSEYFDVILLFEVLEHLEKPAEVFEMLYGRKLAPGGKIVGSVPLNMPDRAHLQLFRVLGDITDMFPVKIRFMEGPFVFFSSLEVGPYGG